MATKVTAALGLERALARGKAQAGTPASASPSRSLRTSVSKPVLSIGEMDPKDVWGALSEKQRAEVRAALGVKPASAAKATAKAAAAPQRPQSTAQAAAELRATIAASRGLPVQPAASTAPAKPAMPARSAAQGWQRAATMQNSLAGLDQAPAPLPYAGQAGWKRAAAMQNERLGL